jgi:hypothetical protein
VNIEMICTMSVLKNKFSRMMRDENKNRHGQAMIWCSPAQRAKKDTVLGGIVCRIQDLKARPTREKSLGCHIKKQEAKKRTAQLLCL